jgi:hypothetical protein
VADQVAGVPLRDPGNRDVEAAGCGGEPRRELLGQDPESLALGDDGLDPALAELFADE